MKEIQREILAKTLEELKSKGFDYLKKITAVDRGTHIEIVYILYNTKSHEQEVLWSKLQNPPEVHTITHMFPAADWYERELSEMFGISIKGRHVRRLLLEEWNGTEAPLRKSFQWGASEYKKVP